MACINSTRTFLLLSWHDSNPDGRDEDPEDGDAAHDDCPDFVLLPEGCDHYGAVPLGVEARERLSAPPVPLEERLTGHVGRVPAATHVHVEESRKQGRGVGGLFFWLHSDRHCARRGCVVDLDLEAFIEVPGASLRAGGPGAGADPDEELGRDDGAERLLGMEVGQDGGDGRVDLEGDQEEEGGEAQGAHGQEDGRQPELELVSPFGSLLGF